MSSNKSEEGLQKENEKSLLIEEIKQHHSCVSKKWWWFYFTVGYSDWVRDGNAVENKYRDSCYPFQSCVS